jgi:predicted nucleic acid-binding protein
VNIFIDTSALAKRYIQEPGSEELEDLFLSVAKKVFVSTLALPEFAAALGRKLRDKEILKQPAAIAWKELEKDWQALFIKIPLTKEIAESAVALATQHPLKGADAAHLATAMAAGASLFVASDQELMRASNKVGLEAYDPSKGPFQ